ncbi:hypothetical protein FIBSPDRAFT_878002 [Athelia psychrophila]|uniref:F-box domain-containing protein n=1 Tax=Athelia psychrophila TaxID=1759441 RepID=A0A167VFU7_9AGAM|nr:hypothetical protein FIBSPDRAFT_878002 [Fibularhizoctonia sp. CBS 109695]
MLESGVSDDVLAEIFLAFGAVTRQEDYWAPSPGPIFLASVCRRWRAVAFSSPRLWASVRIHINRPSRFAGALEIFRLFTARSGACPLEVVINFSNKGQKHRIMMSSVDKEHYRSLAITLATSVERLRHLRTNGHPVFFFTIEQAVAERSASPFPILEALEVRPHTGYIWPDLSHNDYPQLLTVFAASPKLRYASLGYCRFNGGIPYIQLPWQQIEHLDILKATSEGCMQLLRDCPNLARFKVGLSYVEGEESVDLVHHSLRFLELRVDAESTFKYFFESVKLPSLLHLNVHFTSTVHADQFRIQERLISFLPTCRMLQKFVLKQAKVEPQGLNGILRAVPTGLVELEICCEKRCLFGTSYSKLFEELTFKPGRDAPALLPNLHTLSLLGALVLRMDTAALTAMVRSRTSENRSTKRGAVLRSLRIHIGEYPQSMTVEELGEVKAIMGDRADIWMIPVPPRFTLRGLNP